MMLKSLQTVLQCLSVFVKMGLGVAAVNARKTSGASLWEDM